MPRLDRTLEANAFTAFMPSPGLLDRAVHLADGTIGAAFRGLRDLIQARPAPAFDGLRPPGRAEHGMLGAVDAGPLDAATLPNLGTGATLGSHETWRDLPLLPMEQVADVQRYEALIGLAAGPARMSALKQGGLRQDHAVVQDAFSTSAYGAGGKRIGHLLPDSVRNSSLVNTAASFYPGGFGDRQPAVGEPKRGVMTHLWDGKTGFSAGITFDADRNEMTIAFPGLGSSGRGFAQAARCVMNFLGFVPKNMSQASKLTRLVQEHVATLNARLPPDRQIRLTLAGHSMGGGLASYAALRNKVPAVVLNPMHLGWGARARIGAERLEQANRYVTEVVVQGDWVADNKASRLYAPLGPVFDSRGPLGTARRFMVPGYGMPTQHRHNAVGALAADMVQHHRTLGERAPTLLPLLQAAGGLERGKMLAGKMQPALRDAILKDAKAEATGFRIRDADARWIARVTDTLIRGTGGDGKALDGAEIAGLRRLLGRHIAQMQADNAGQPLPRILRAIEADFVSQVPQAARSAFAAQDTTARQALAELRQDHAPGGAACAALLARFDLPPDTREELLPAKVLAREIAAQLDLEFGAGGEGFGAAQGPANEARAAQAVMRAAAAMLATQLMMAGDDPELARLHGLAQGWAAGAAPAGL
jgi:hypothetical protein